MTWVQNDLFCFNKTTYKMTWVRNGLRIVVFNMIVLKLFFRNEPCYVRASYQTCRKSRGAEELMFSLGRFRQVFSQEQEQVLQEYLMVAANIYFGL